ncbi:hypothetical protein, partial [Acinetobacter baumannii]|uniref:hypothetical protein n=1 Tax=Acinetobacter baumannii TaxID=470 RepID=UPI002FE3C936
MSSAGGDCGYIAAMSGKPASEVAERSKRNKHVAVVVVYRFRLGHSYNHSCHALTQHAQRFLGGISPARS